MWQERTETPAGVTRGVDRDDRAAQAVLSPETELALARAAASPDERVVILLVEDDPGDQELIQRAFEECSGQVDLRIVPDGEEARDYLYRFGKYEARNVSPRPKLILLDLNLPKLTGFRLLEEIRGDALFHTIPIIVLTSSSEDTDIVRSYAKGANSYITKPCSFDGYCRMIRVLEAYWLRRAALPPQGL